MHSNSLIISLFLLSFFDFSYGQEDVIHVKTRIIGGRRARKDEFPNQVMIIVNINIYHEQSCGGTIIDDHCILTAGYCVYGDSIKL